MSTRMKQINPQLQLKLGEIFSKELEFPNDYLVTITKVDCSPDLRTAKVFLSVLPADKKHDALKYVINNRKLIQRELGKSIHLKRTPELRFEFDDTAERVSEIDSLLAEVDKSESRD